MLDPVEFSRVLSKQDPNQTRLKERFADFLAEYERITASRKLTPTPFTTMSSRSTVRPVNDAASLCGLPELDSAGVVWRSSNTRELRRLNEHLQPLL
jgi:hypothetical protein